MARGKHGPALFEVIRNAQQKQKEQVERQKKQQEAAELKAKTVRGPSQASELLSSVTYWAKGKLAHEETQKAAGPTDETPAAAAPAVAAAPAKPAPAAKPPTVFRDVPPVAPVIAAQEMVDGPSTPQVLKPAPAPAYESPAMIAARQVRQELAAQDAPVAEPFFAGDKTSFDDVADDDTAAGRDPSAPFNYAAAAVAAVAILLAFGGAYLIGGRGEKTQIAKTDVRPQVLDVGPTRTAPPTPVINDVAPPSPVKPTPTVNEEALASVPKANDPLQLETLGRPIPLPTNVRRDAGMHYIVLLSFPLADDAKELVKFLAQNGVPATAETALPGYAKSWTSVVTTRGFDHVRDNPAYDRYSNALKDLLAQYAGDVKFRKTFRVQAYKWRAAK